jgi:hypothetical protein
MINFHLGMPRIGFRSFGFVERNRRLLRPSATFLVPNDFYRDHVRSTVNTKFNFLSMADVAKVQELLGQWDNFEGLSISHPALLGDPRQLILSSRARKKAAIRLQILRAVFHSQQVCFHLLITNQAEYLHRACPDEAEMLIRNSETFSWVAFIEEIGLLSSRNSLSVWNCDHGTCILNQFLEKFIDQPKPTTDALFARSIGYRFPDISVLQRKLLNPINRNLDYYQANYLEDLAELERTEGVTVMGLP